MWSETVNYNLNASVNSDSVNLPPFCIIVDQTSHDYSGCGEARADSAYDRTNKRREEKTNRQNASHDKAEEAECPEDSGIHRIAPPICNLPANPFELDKSFSALVDTYLLCAQALWRRAIVRFCMCLERNPDYPHDKFLHWTIRHDPTLFEEPFYFNLVTEERLPWKKRPIAYTLFGDRTMSTQGYS